MVNLQAQPRRLMYLQPPSGVDELQQRIVKSGWEIQTVTDVGSVHQHLSDTACNVGIAHVDELIANSYAQAEELFSTTHNMVWIALAQQDAILSSDVCKLIHDNFYDYYTLPLYNNVENLLSTLGHAHGMAMLQNREDNQDIYTDYEMVGASPPMLDLFASIRKVASVDAPVLITGESGTGKELIAHAVHERSSRSSGPFVAINCGALPANLIQSELFGHEKGAFTGAINRQVGRLEKASGGTLFLDEIGDLPLDLQVNLLRFLQEGTIERVGGTESIQLNVRVLCATHMDLEEAIRQGRFREDLMYRLNVLQLRPPPLRERGDDIELMARFFFSKFRNEAPRATKGFSKRALQAMKSYHWPGNVREIINMVRRAMVMCEGNLITPADLGLDSAPEPVMSVTTLHEARILAERDVINGALKRTGNNVTKAAALLDVSRVTLYRLINKHEIEGAI